MIKKINSTIRGTAVSDICTTSFSHCPQSLGSVALLLDNAKRYQLLMFAALPLFLHFFPFSALAIYSSADKQMLLVGYSCISSLVVNVHQMLAHEPAN